MFFIMFPSTILKNLEKRVLDINPEIT